LWCECSGSRWPLHQQHLDQQTSLAAALHSLMQQLEEQTPAAAAHHNDKQHHWQLEHRQRRHSTAIDPLLVQLHFLGTGQGVVWDVYTPGPRPSGVGPGDAVTGVMGGSVHTPQVALSVPPGSDSKSSTSHSRMVSSQSGGKQQSSTTDDPERLPRCRLAWPVATPAGQGCPAVAAAAAGQGGTEVGQLPVGLSVAAAAAGSAFAPPLLRKVHAAASTDDAVSLQGAEEQQQQHPDVNSQPAVQAAAPHTLLQPMLPPVERWSLTGSRSGCVSPGFTPGCSQPHAPQLLLTLSSSSHLVTVPGSGRGASVAVLATAGGRTLCQRRPRQHRHLALLLLRHCLLRGLMLLLMQHLVPLVLTQIRCRCLPHNQPRVSQWTLTAQPNLTLVAKRQLLPRHWSLAVSPQLFVLPPLQQQVGLAHLLLIGKVSGAPVLLLLLPPHLLLKAVSVTMRTSAVLTLSAMTGQQQTVV